MAEEVEMIPVEGVEPPKANPLAKPVSDKVSTIKLSPLARKPVPGAAPSSALKPGLKLPTQTALRPGLKLPTKPGFGAGLKLPPKPGIGTGVKLPPKPGAGAAGAFKPGLKLPTQTALKPGVKLPPKPVIRKPGATVAAPSLPKPVARVATPPDVEPPKPMEQLKTVTQKLKGITQEIPQQAVLHKTGIIAEGNANDAQKEAAKHKTARISLSDAMGVAPVKDEAAPMKTIRIKRPVNIPTSTSSLTPPPRADAPAAATPTPTPAPAASSAPAAPTITQRKTLKIARPGGAAVRPGGKFGVKRPSSQAATVKSAAPKPVAPAASAEGEVADIPDLPSAPVPPVPVRATGTDAGPAWAWTLSAIVQLAACVAIGALAWFLYENSQLPTYCGGLGWAP